MRKSIGLVLVFLTAAVIVLSIAVSCLFIKDADNPPAEPASSSAPSSVQAEPSEVLEEENSVESGAGAAEPDGEITGLRCAVELGTLSIVEGETFHVSELNGSDYAAYIENGIYIVNGTTTHENHVIVTIPENFEFETVELVVTGGALAAENISTQNLYTSCEKGAIDYSGSVAASADVQQFQGKTVLNLDGKPTDYNYNLNLALGHIGIGEQEYAGSHPHESIENEAEKTIDANCTMGSIYILFSEDFKS